VKNLQEYYSDLSIKCKILICYHKRNNIQLFFLTLVRYNTKLVQTTLPPLIVLAIISTKNEGKSNKQMSIELVSSEIEFELSSQDIEKEQTKEIEQEIECPRCHDIMALSSEFDK
jgi:hypothetical protein